MSGRTTAEHDGQWGTRPARASSKSSMVERAPHPVHSSLVQFPWSSSTRLEPAAWWRPSMFWVTTAFSFPARSRPARKRWAAFGATPSRAVSSANQA